MARSINEILETSRITEAHEVAKVLIALREARDVLKEAGSPFNNTSHLDAQKLLKKWGKHD